MMPFLLLLFALSTLGDVVQQLTAAPVPGPVIGMSVLLAALALRRRVPAGLQSTARGLLQCLPILFVPAGAGVMTRLPLMQAEWLPILLALLGSTIVALVTTACVMRAVERRVWRGLAKPAAPVGGSGAP